MVADAALPCPPTLQEFDEDQSGFLDRQEFKKCLASARLGLTSREINTIMAEVDENEDGVIEYGEFMPLAIELLQSMQVSGEVAEASKQVREPVREMRRGVLAAAVNSRCPAPPLGCRGRRRRCGRRRPSW